MPFKIYLYAICLSFVSLCHVTSANVHYVDCGSHWAMADLTIDGCSSGHNCVLHINHNTTISFTFKSGTLDIDADLINDVALHIRGVIFDMEITPADPCQVLICPVSKNYTTKYSADVFVEERFAPTYAQLKWIMKTAQEEQMLCFEINVILNYVS